MSSKAQAAVKVPAQQPQAQSNHLYVKVTTYNTEGREVGTRVVDMYHYGTRNWLQGHMWWAMHHSNTVECLIADDGDVADYVKEQELKLLDKFAKTAA